MQRGISNQKLAARILFLIFLVGASSVTFCQQESQSAIDPHDPVFRAQYKDVEFVDNFALQVAGDSTNNYYILDMTRLNSRFEKIWFINLIFKEGTVVTIDSDISQDQFWFLANRKYNQTDVLDRFSELKEATDEVSARMTAEEKSEWLKVNDKYN